MSNYLETLGDVPWDDWTARQTIALLSIAESLAVLAAESANRQAARKTEQGQLLAEFIRLNDYLESAAERYNRNPTDRNGAAMFGAEQRRDAFADAHPEVWQLWEQARKAVPA